MNVEISYATIGEMLEIFSQLKENKIDKVKLKKILEHRDYQIEFERYGDRVFKEEFADFICSYISIEPEKIRKGDLKGRYNDFKYLLDNLDLYKKEYKKLEKYDKEIFLKQVDFAKKGLPEVIEFDELTFLFTIGIGISFGWPYNNYTHYDFVQLVRDYDIDSFFSIVSHEIHHVGMNRLYKKYSHDKLGLKESFIIEMASEGLAVKYCNNAEGVLSKAIYKDKPKNIGLNKYSWDYLNEHFDYAFNMFKEHLKRIDNNEFKNKDELMNEYELKWNDRYTFEQDKKEMPKLLHSWDYSLGNDIWGVIHDVFGKEKVFEVLKNPSIFFEIYNEAVKKIDKKEYIIGE